MVIPMFFLIVVFVSFFTGYFVHRLTIQMVLEKLLSISLFPSQGLNLYRSEHKS